jgi:hypothetical protein
MNTSDDRHLVPASRTNECGTTVKENDNDEDDDTIPKSNFHENMIYYLTNSNTVPISATTHVRV